MVSPQEVRFIVFKDVTTFLISTKRPLTITFSSVSHTALNSLALGHDANALVKLHFPFIFHTILLSIVNLVPSYIPLYSIDCGLSGLPKVVIGGAVNLEQPVNIFPKLVTFETSKFSNPIRPSLVRLLQPDKKPARVFLPLLGLKLVTSI